MVEELSYNNKVYTKNYQKNKPLLRIAINQILSGLLKLGKVSYFYIIDKKTL